MAGFASRAMGLLLLPLLCSCGFLRYERISEDSVPAQIAGGSTLAPGETDGEQSLSGPVGCGRGCDTELSGPLPAPAEPCGSFTWSYFFNDDVDGNPPDLAALGWTPLNGGFRTGGYGGENDEYLSSTTNGGDRSLSGFKGSGGNVIGWTFALENSTPDTLRGLRFCYDAEVSWVRHPQDDTATEATLQWRFNDELVSSAPTITNAQVTADLIQTWFGDNRMDELGLSERQLSFEINDLSVAPGEVFEIILRLPQTSGDEKMNAGIDNLFIQVL